MAIIRFPDAATRKRGGFLKGTRCWACKGQLYYDGPDREVVCLACSRRSGHIHLVDERTVRWTPPYPPAA